MDDEDFFHLQLAKTIQAWLGIESDLYSLYAMLMQGANSHLISATFNSIQSVDAKLYLLNSCFTLVFSRISDDLKEWRSLSRKIEKLNKKRNKIVHEPISILHSKGERTILLGPSHMNAMALVKGQTTHKGEPIISAEYNPQEAKLLKDHQMDLRALISLERAFKATSTELSAFREKVTPTIAAAVNAASRPQ